MGLFTNLAQSIARNGDIRAMSGYIDMPGASKPNGTSQAGRRRRAKRALSHSGRTRGRIR